MRSKRFGLGLYAIFALSGFSGLIYESIWTHYLKLFLGHAAYAQFLVLCIFMGGMALGAWLTARIVHRLQNLLLIYALVEAVIGVCGLGFHTVFSSVQAISYDYIFPSLESSFAVQSYKWSLATLLILPQSILLGTTFPLMSNALIRLFPDRTGYSLSVLYFANSLGASIGVLVSGFFLISKAGLPGTIMTAAVLNIFIAVLIYLVAKKQTSQFTPEPQKNYHHPYPLLILFAAFITGTASFIYEIAWLRLLSMVLGASTHAFELMLGAFIFGLSIGSLWIRNRIDKIDNPLKLVGNIQIIMGVMALLTLPVYNYTFELMAFFMHALDETESGYILFNIASHLIALLVMLPATICAGMTLPLFTHILVTQGYGERGVGQVYASNTIGAIAGVGFIILIGLPVLGLKGSIMFGAGLDISLGLILIITAPGGSYSFRKKAVFRFSIPVLILVLTSFLSLDTMKMNSGVFRYGQASLLDTSILYYEDGKTASISVTRSAGNQLSLRTNGKPDALINMDESSGPSSDEYTMTLLGALPISIYPQAKTVAAIGMGSGLTSHTLLSWPGISSVDTIEIEPAVVEAAGFFRPRVEKVFSDQRSNIYIEDAKSFFSSHNKKYDILVSEPSNPWVSGVSSLFTEEFYTVIKKYLNQNGLFVQWLHTYELDNELLYSVIKAISTQFVDFKIYASNQFDLILVASADGTVPFPDEKIFTSDEMADELSQINIHNIHDLNLRFLGGKELFGTYIDNQTYSINSDYFPILDQFSPRSRFMQMQAADIFGPAAFYLPLLQTFYPTLDSDYSDTKANTKYLRIEKPILLARDLLKSFEDDSSKMNNKTYQYYIDYLKQGSETCGQIEHDSLWVESIFNVMTKTLPYLHPLESKKIHHMMISTCSGEISSNRVQWLNLFSALGDRDEDKILSVSIDMLDQEFIASLPQKRYILSAFMMSSISANRPDLILNILSEHKDIFANNLHDLPITLKLLLAIALQSSPQ